MKLIILKFNYWSTELKSLVTVKIIAENKEQATVKACRVTTDINLLKSLKEGASLPISDYNAVTNMPWYSNLDWEVFKLNPEKYVNFEWSEMDIQDVEVTAIDSTNL